MDRPSLVEILAKFARVPTRWLYDVQVLQETWEWALEEGDSPPEPTFSCDDLPVLCFMAVYDDSDEDCGRAYLLPSGIVLQ